MVRLNLMVLKSECFRNNACMYFDWKVAQLPNYALSRENPEELQSGFTLMWMMIKIMKQV